MTIQHLPILKLLPHYAAIKGIIDNAQNDIRNLTRQDIRIDIEHYNIKSIIERITLLVADNLNVSFIDILSTSRKVEIVEARQIAMALANRYIPGIRLQQIATFYSKDHSTVIHACRHILNLMHAGDEVMLSKYNLCKQELLNKINAPAP